MFEEMTTIDILNNLKCIKLPKQLRVFVLKTRSDLESTGVVGLAAVLKIRNIATRYQKKIIELQDSRDRARRTNSLKKVGMNRDDLEVQMAIRQAKKEKMSSDVGF